MTGYIPPGASDPNLLRLKTRLVVHLGAVCDPVSQVQIRQVQAARLYVLVDDTVRRRCLEFVAQSPTGYEVLITPERMNDGQRSKFHAICSDFARSGIEWGGQQRTALEWKVLLISGHAAATRQEVEVLEGLEGELVSVRESTTSMSKQRGSSVIEYAIAMASMRGVRLREPQRRNINN